jgi:PiT family inorganic phosphate transporter
VFLGGDIVVGLAIGLGLVMAFSIGGNDVANAMGTSVGSRALSLRQAVLVAAVLEFGGAFLVGGHVTKTIRGGILDPAIAASAPDVVVYGMLAALTAAGLWLLAATRLGWPVSTTHSIVGAIAGFGAVALGLEAVQWEKMLRIVASWGISPLLAGTLAFLIFNLIRRTILDHPQPVAQIRRWGPVYIFAVVAVIGLVTLFKGLKHVKLDLDFKSALALTVLIGLVVAGIGRHFILRISVDPDADASFHFATVERMFGVLQILSACAVAFAHGSNDVANAIGPLAAVLDIQRSGLVRPEAPVPPELLLIGGVGIVAGLAIIGYRVMATIGERITELTPSRGYAAEFAAASTIVIASRLGIPVSTTHVLVGAVLGVGLARGIGALDYRVVGTILLSWLVTIPAGAALAIFFYYFYKGLLTSLGGA